MGSWIPPGLSRGVGRALKAYQIESIRPDVIVCIEHRDELGPLIRSQRTHNILRIGASPSAVSKSREERIAARQRSFKTYFENAQDLVLHLSDIAFQRFPIFGGTRVEVDGSTCVEKYPEGTVAVSDMPKDVFEHEATVFPTGFDRGLRCGVLDGRNAVIGSALLQELDFRTGPVPSIASVTKLNE